MPILIKNHPSRKRGFIVLTTFIVAIVLIYFFILQNKALKNEIWSTISGELETFDIKWQ
ncbi:MAG: hypothetical protein WA063_07230 [Minisyncoccia bacterium]